jgi:hypothetical protein
MQLPPTLLSYHFYLPDLGDHLPDKSPEGFQKTGQLPNLEAATKGNL